MDEGTRRLVVGRVRKPHGLKGDCAIFPLTDDPATVLATGRVVWVVNLEGEAVVGPLTIARSRSFHREWLVSFEGWPDRSAVEPLGQTFLAVAAEELTPPVGDEVYLDELIGFAVRSVEGIKKQTSIAKEGSGSVSVSLASSRRKGRRRSVIRKSTSRFSLSRT